mgnify:CR=1 FL=1
MITSTRGKKSLFSVRGTRKYSQSPCTLGQFIKNRHVGICDNEAPSWSASCEERAQDKNTTGSRVKGPRIPATDRRTRATSSVTV